MGLSRELRSRLLTLLLLVLVAGALYVYARREDLLHAPRPVSGLLYPELDTEAITSLHLGLIRGQVLELQRPPGGPWRITEPTTEQARQEYVETILDNLARAQVQPVEVDGEVLSARDVGLEPPRHHITFGNATQRESLLLGDPEPLGGMAYARRSGDRDIVLATRNLLTLLQFNAADFTDPVLLRGLSGPVTHVRVERDDAVLLDARRSGDAWTLHEPVAALADGERITGLIRALQFVRQERVIANDPLSAELHELGLPDPEDRAAGRTHGAMLIELGAEGEAPVRVWVAAGWQHSAGEVAALREDGRKVLAVPRAGLAQLNNDAGFFRDHHVLPPLRDRAESLVMQRDGEVLLDIRRGAGGAWTFAAPARLAGDTVENERIESHSVLGDFLERIDGLVVTGFCALPAGEPVARLAIGWTRTGEKRLDTVEFYAPTPDGVPAVTSERPQEGLLLPDSVLELFAPHTPDVLRRLAPLAVDAERWKRLRLELPDSPPLEIARGADGSWTGDDAWGRRFGLGKDLLRGFRGLQWRPARAGADYPWRVLFLDEAGGELGSLRLRLPAEGEPQEASGFPCAVAALPGHDGVELVVARQWVDQLQALASELRRQP